MKINLLSGLLMAVICLTSLASFSQQKSFEFEKVSPADFSAVNTKDSSAVAEVIADVGNTQFGYDINGFYLIFERKTRIHILKQEGTSYATIEIPLYKNGSEKELVATFKGFTYNLEQGEVIKTKVRNEDIFLLEESETWDTRRIAMPAVKANSIIEFEYKILSPFTFNLQPWRFQYDIPISWSEYNVKIPEYYIYKNISQGYIPFVINENIRGKQKFTYQYEPDALTKIKSPGMRIIKTTDDSFDMDVNNYRWVAVQVPAMKPEPFISTTNDYISKIEFELSIINIPGETYEQVMDTWETLNYKLLENSKFGLLIKKSNFISDKLPDILKNTSNDVEKVKAIFDHIKSRMKWDETTGVFANNPPKKIYETRTGSVADINLMLVAMLKEAGFNAEPVILSTRSHGRIQEVYPILDKFNYVVAEVRIDTTNYLLDATAKYLPFNTLPERCLNGSGRIISKTSPGWIQLLNTETKYTYTQVDLNLAAEGTLTGKCIINSAGLNGNDKRNAYNTKSEKEFLKEFTNTHQSFTVTDFKLSNLDTLNKPLTEAYTIEASDAAQVAGDHIYLNMMVGFGQKSNPFKLEKRVYPIDFSCPIKENYFINIKIPDGWVVEQLPLPAIVTLPDKAGTFKCQLKASSGVIQISSSFIISKTLFLPSEYDILKDFFRLVVSKHAEQIVLKKA